MFRYPTDVREALLAHLRETLQIQPEAAFAYVHGSILTSLPFRDIDIAVYWHVQDLQEIRHCLFSSLESLEQSLSTMTSLHKAPPVDLLALNQAPLGFRYQVLQRGRLLFSRDEPLRVRWTVETLTRYLDIRPLREQALKEAMTA